VLVVDPQGRAMPERAVACASEAAVLRAFAERVRALDPDVLTGWNVIDFDLAMLAKIAARVRAPLSLGRGDGEMRIRPAEGYFGSGRPACPDGWCWTASTCCAAPSCASTTTASTRWPAACSARARPWKAMSSDRVGEILANYRDDLPRFALYARTDARLALEIVERLDLVPSRSRAAASPA
jgi:DNA polymerase II